MGLLSKIFKRKKEKKINYYGYKEKISGLMSDYWNALQEWEKVKHEAHIRAIIYARIAAKAKLRGNQVLYERMRDKTNDWLIRYKRASANVKTLRYFYRLASQVATMLERGASVELIEKTLKMPINQFAEKLSNTLVDSLTRLKEAEVSAEVVSEMEESFLADSEIEKQVDEMISREMFEKGTLNVDDLIESFLEKEKANKKEEKERE